MTLDLSVIASAFGPPAYTFRVSFIMLAQLTRALQRIARSYSEHGLAADDEEGRHDVLRALALVEACARAMLDQPRATDLMLPVDDSSTLLGIRHGFNVLLSTLDDRRKHNMTERLWVRNLLDSIAAELDRNPIDRLADLAARVTRDLSPIGHGALPGT